ncbi:MAG: Xaa-Pro peptidase family protein [Nitrospinota bacterium]|nr:Xaa-Pro peptidase family protein [Nitrospinota bacterium]
MQIPYNEEKFDTLMDDAGIDLVLASTRQNIRYLSGGYFYHFHERFTAFGESQYTPLVGVPRGKQDQTFYIGHENEAGQAAEESLWFTDIINGPRVTSASGENAANAIKKLGLEKGTIAVEKDFLPATALDTMRKELPDVNFVEALFVLEELRAVKTKEEIEVMRRITEADSEAIELGFQSGKGGATTIEIAQTVERELTNRGVCFLWVFTSAGTKMLRAPSNKNWEIGEVLHLDAGGSENDYLTDVCRMGVRGEPSKEASDVYTSCLTIQDEVRLAIRKGERYNTIYNLGEKILEESGHSKYGSFIIHGVGLISHEQPRFGSDIERELESGMIISIETDIRHPEIGYVKLEDTVVVTDNGCEGLGDAGREFYTIIE